jgi:hypothetical protein
MIFSRSCWLHRILSMSSTSGLPFAECCFQLIFVGYVERLRTSLRILNIQIAAPETLEHTILTKRTVQQRYWFCILNIRSDRKSSGNHQEIEMSGFIAAIKESFFVEYLLAYISLDGSWEKQPQHNS